MSEGTSRIVVPSDIPWRAFTSQALEELLFWLCDAQGATDVQWRTGAAGPSADGGRDVEATFYSVADDGALQPELWWLQAKGRSKTVEPMAVKEAAITAAGSADVDVVVVATNSAFSNPTRDWVREWNRGHARPRVILWDQHALERMVVTHPSVIARIAPEALSATGQLEAISARFYSSTRLAARHELVHLWQRLDELRMNVRDVVALLCAELENGSIVERPWTSVIGVDDRMYVCAFWLIELPSLLHRAIKLGTGTEPLLAVTAHLIAVAVAYLPTAIVTALLEDPSQFVEGIDKPSKETVASYHDLILEPPIRRFRERFGARCAQDCHRMSADLEDRSAVDVLATLTAVQHRRDDRTIRIENLRAACPVGLELDENRTCPWFRDGPFEDALPDIQQALRARLAQSLEETSEAV